MALQPIHEGPRTPTEQEWPAVCELTRSIFSKDAISFWDAFRRVPMSLHPTAREHHLTIFQDGQPLSTILRMERDISVLGHHLRLGFIGSVCTHPDHRGQGLASAILASVLEQFRRDGVDLVFISGGRPLYFGAGANRVAIEERFHLGKEGLPSKGPEVQLRQARQEDIDQLRALSETEGTRFIRPRLDWEIVLREGYCRGRETSFELVACQGAAVGYIMLERDTRQNQLVVSEVAGERLCLLAALRQICTRLEGEMRLQINPPRGDLLCALLRRSGASEEIGARSRGTMMLLDFPRLMGKLVPYFQERLPGCHALNLQAVAGKERYVAWCDSGYLQITGQANMLWLMLGRPAEAPYEGVQASGRMQELIERCLPLSLPSVAMNTI